MINDKEMKKETWLKIGSLLIYLFVPAFVIRLFFGFVEILFLVQIPEAVSLSVISITTTFILLFGIVMAIMDDYILKQKDK